MSSPWKWSSSLKKLVNSVLSGRGQEAEVFYEPISEFPRAQYDGEEEEEEEEKGREGKRKQEGSRSQSQSGERPLAKRRRSSHPGEGITPISKELDEEEFTFHSARTPVPNYGGIRWSRKLRSISLKSEGSSERKAEKARQQAFGQGSPSLELLRQRAQLERSADQEASQHGFCSSDELSETEAGEYKQTISGASGRVPLHYQTEHNPLYSRRTTVDEFGEPYTTVVVEPGFHYYPIVSGDDILESSAIVSRRECGAVALRTLNTGNFKYPQKTGELKDNNRKAGTMRIGKERKRPMNDDIPHSSKRMRVETSCTDENVGCPNYCVPADEPLQ